MSIFSKPVSQIQHGDLQELVQENAIENLRLEFKSDIPNKDETLKKLSSFANTLGGYLVIGAKADSTDGRIQGLLGANPESGYKQKVIQWCFDAVSPPVTVEVSDPIPSPTDGGKVCYVISVPESDTAPHFLNGRKGVWVRIDEFSGRFEARLANETELRHLFDRRKLVQERRGRLVERARKRFDAYIAMGHTDAGGQRTRVGPLLQMCIVPRFPSRQLCEQSSLKQHLLSTATNWRQTIFPDLSRRQLVWQHESAILIDPVVRTSLLEVNTWGSLFYGTGVEMTFNQLRGIHPLDVVGYVLVFIRHAGAMLRAMAFSGPILVETSFVSLLDADWFLSIPGGAAVIDANSKPQFDDEVVFPVTATREALIEKPDGIAMAILQNLFFGANRPGYVDTPQNLENLIRAGYQFNFWPKPIAMKA